ncbi:MAG TPA: M23 family metallopeptidase [Gaiellaceae bacterium]|jgi:murein DD-endopeptidase MepM/ murein hydrolase activator NlpD|nr:M23 family metallopeptidase [Gaiellaceae bacterium]
MRRGLCAIFVALLFPAAASAHTDAGWQLAFRWPAEGTITSPFGHDGARWHPGLDIGILRSLDVRAAAEGVVTQVGFVRGYEGYGSVVLVRHGDGYSTLYAHLSRPLVHVGEHVWQAERIALAGCTGWCTGTHLHFELRHRGIPIDPSLLIVG